MSLKYVSVSCLKLQRYDVSKNIRLIAMLTQFLNWNFICVISYIHFNPFSTSFIPNFSSFLSLFFLASHNQNYFCVLCYFVFFLFISSVLDFLHYNMKCVWEILTIHRFFPSSNHSTKKKKYSSLFTAIVHINQFANKYVEIY